MRTLIISYCFYHFSWAVQPDVLLLLLQVRSFLADRAVSWVKFIEMLPFFLIVHPSLLRLTSFVAFVQLVFCVMIASSLTVLPDRPTTQVTPSSSRNFAPRPAPLHSLVTGVTSTD